MGLLEKRVHQKLTAYRVDDGEGREWFYAEPWQADCIIRGLIVEYELAQAMPSLPMS